MKKININDLLLLQQGLDNFAVQDNKNQLKLNYSKCITFNKNVDNTEQNKANQRLEYYNR